MRTRKTNPTSRRTTYTTYRNYNYNNPTRTTRPITTMYSCNSPRFNNIRNEFQWRIGSYRNVYNQFNTGQKTNWSPTVANRWMRYVNNGVQVYMFTNRQFTQYFGARWANANPTVIRKYLASRFGQMIKDVTRGNHNTWLIATSRTPTARPFTNYNWYK
ncbi:MAG: hypothetical protein AB1716_07565 [Planctomycetota bacterium]